MISDLFRIAIINLRHRKLRTWLTVLGVIIGIGAIVALITVSSGLSNAINDQFSKMGSSRVEIYSKGVMQGNIAAEGITTKDVEVVKRMSEVEWVNVFLLGGREAEYGREKEFMQNLMGVDTEDAKVKFESFGFKVGKGRYFNNGERGVMIIGYKAQKDMFDKDINIGNKIVISDYDFKVIGIMEEIGNPDDDNNIYIPLEDARDILNEPDKVTTIDTKIKEGVDVDMAAKKIKDALEKARDDENFEVVTPEQLISQMGSILDILNIILGGIAAISIVVGGVGIMNSTYTSVLERTKEIGIMKSIGAKNRDILSVFLIESGLIGLVGGLLGILTGTLISLGAGAAMKSMGFAMIRINIDWKLWALSLAFAIMIGLMSGYFPAKKASQLKPADAMRY